MSRSKRSGTKGKESAVSAEQRFLDREVKALSRDAIRATTAGDIKSLASVVAKDFTFVDDRGVSLSAGACFQSLRDLVSNPAPDRDALQVKSFRTDEVQRRFYGDTVIETMIYKDNVAVKHKGVRDREFTRSFRLTNVWVREDDSMKLASLQLTPLQWV